MRTNFHRRLSFSAIWVQLRFRPAIDLWIVLLAAALLLPSALCPRCFGSPFARQFSFTQPDGTAIRLWGQGDEFSAVFETLEGYTVVFVPETRAYCYARVSTDGTALQSTGAVVGRENPAALGLLPHQRVDPSAARAAAASRFKAWDNTMRLNQRQAELQALNPDDRPRSVRPLGVTIGAKCGLTLLIDFEDERGAISREEVIQFLNGDHYAGFGNHGSVKEYYADVSGGKLTFTNVVTPYVTIPNSLHPRSYYNDPTRDCGQQGALLIRDALNVMKALPNFTNDFLPLFQAVTVNSQNKAVSANFFIAGPSSGVWAKGIWGHAWALSVSVGQQALWPGGKVVDRYQLSEMMDTLYLYIFAHENAHLLCGLQDLYDYSMDSFGGVGRFCLMGHLVSEASFLNPPQFCALLKIRAGWASVTDLPPRTNFLASLSASGADFNHFYRFQKPGVTTEYFLLENRQASGRDTDLPASGIALWHVDELGTVYNHSLMTNTSHLNFPVTLEPADHRWDFQLNANAGDPEDLFYAENPAAGYPNAFSDLTSPSAQWWDGARSGLILSGFTANGPTITFNVKSEPPVVRFDPVDLTVAETQPAAFSFATSPLLNPAYQWYKDGLPLTASAGLSGVDSTRLTLAAAAFSDAGDYWAVITYSTGTATTRVARLTVQLGPPRLSANLGGQGTTTLLPNGADLTSTGTGVRGANDSCRFTFQTLARDFDVRVHLLGVNMANNESRAGLMIRKAVTASSPHVSLLTGLTTAEATPCSVLTRVTQGGPTQELVGYLAPLGDTRQRWQRIQRQGNRYTCYLSANGSDWTWLRSLELDLGSEVCVGLALAAGPGATNPACAWFRDYVVTTNTPTSLAIFTPDPVAPEGAWKSAQVAVYASRNGPLEATVQFGGTAVSGLDYLPLPSTVLIPEGTNVAWLDLRALNNALVSPPKIVEIALAEQPNVELVQPGRAAVLIQDDERVTGGLLSQVYAQCGGWQVADLTRQMANLNALTEVGFVTRFEAPTNRLDYGQILSGYLVPPATGDYVFYLASAENSELWLSTDEDPANARRIAAVSGFTAFRDYSGSANHSDAIPLEQGKFYYVKALHKQHAVYGEVDLHPGHLSLAWQLPGGAAPANGSAPIDGACLAFALPPANDLSLAPQAASFSAAANAALVAVTSAGAWSAQSLDSWIVLCGETNGVGTGQVAYLVGANPTGARRAGTIVINGRTHSVIQAAPPLLAIGFTPAQTLALTIHSTTPVVVEASGDLQRWLPIWTNTVPATLPLVQIDPLAPAALIRFYRAVAK